MAEEKQKPGNAVPAEANPPHENNARRKDTPELFDYYMIGLRTTWDSLKLDAEQQKSKHCLTITRLFQECEAGDGDWDALWKRAYEIEQRMACFLTDEQLEPESRRRLFEAEKLGIPSAAIHKQSIDAAIALPADKRHGPLCAAYATLLDDLHWGYGKRRLDRETRRKVAEPIIWFALLLIAGVAAVIGLSSWMAPDYPHFRALGIVVGFGLLGAFFSRLGTFSSSFSQLDYDQINNMFRGRILTVRLLVGMIGSIILFYAIFANLISGELFPKVACLNTTGVKDAADCKVATWMTATASRGLMPGADLAKLIVWSFIGGFSERLIPDFLARSEKAAASSGPNSA